MIKWRALRLELPDSLRISASRFQSGSHADQDRPDEVGHIWPELYKFVRIQSAPLTLLETRAIVEQAVAQKNIQADASKHAGNLHQMSGGNPLILGELLIELAVRGYKIDDASGLDLLDLDRRIQEIDLSIKATAEMHR